MEREILILDPGTHNVVGSCSGPSANGACPRVAIGEMVPCASYELALSGARDARSYEVSPRMTLCPLTVAEALAVQSDSTLIAA
ncbi:MAG TPA: hypothetical protein VND54_06070 [Candidatus Saccharimonadales bacterium]|nr:hypothetical protein [Candidatus Saccharimonadales bacterium]